MRLLAAQSCTHLVLDACCAITLVESAHMAAILSATNLRVVITRYVVQHEVQRQDVQPLIDAGVLSLVAPETEAELNEYVDLARDLDDGEAVSGALAVHRKWALATDETKALRFFAETYPEIPLISTPGLIKHWVEVTQPAREVVRSALLRIQSQAHYRPGKLHPLWDWWHDASADS